MKRLPLRRRAAIGALLFPIFVTLTACSGTSSKQPNDDEVEQAIRMAVLTDGKEQVMSVENFKKLNGRLKPDGTYVADVSYDLVFSKSYTDLKLEYHVDGGKSAAQLGPVATVLYTFQANNGQWKAGSHFPMTNTIPLVKSEKGWIISND